MRSNGGRATSWNGYTLILAPDHPHCDVRGYVREHRLIIEQAIGRILNPEERVHHKNGVKTDNRIENLELVSSESDHYSRHLDEHRENSRRAISTLRARYGDKHFVELARLGREARAVQFANHMD